jgi:glycosyltransferase involved in cell wall biosynthesis
MSLDLAVLGQDPRFGGGAHAQTTAFCAAAEQLGREPELLFEPHPGLDGSLTWRRVEALRQERAARRLAAPALHARSLWVVSSLAHNGGAAPRTGRAYGCWAGTTIDAEWSGRSPGLTRGRRALAAASLPAIRRLERSVLQGAARLYATSAASQASVADAAGTTVSDVGLLPIPVELDRFAPEPDDVWLARLDAPVLGFVGRLDDPRKNATLLVRAFAIVRAELPQARLRLIGSGAAPVGAGIESLGFVDDVAAALRECALLVSAARQEGFGIAVAEALACGVPVVSTPSGGPEELLRASAGGLVLAGWSERELADAVLDLLADRARLLDMRRRGRGHVAREHAPERLRQLLAAAFEDLDG